MEVVNIGNQKKISNLERKVSLLLAHRQGREFTAEEMRARSKEFWRNSARFTSSERGLRGQAMGRHSKGFSLVEVVVAFAILMVVSAIAIPYYLSALQSADEAWAVGYFRQLQIAQESSMNENQVYADNFTELGDYMAARLNLPGEYVPQPTELLGEVAFAEPATFPPGIQGHHLEVGGRCPRRALRPPVSRRRVRPPMHACQTRPTRCSNHPTSSPFPAPISLTIRSGRNQPAIAPTDAAFILL